MNYDALLIQNYTAGENIAAGQPISFKAYSVAAPTCEVADLSNLNVIGVSIKNVKAGEAVSFLPFVTGQTINVLLGGSVTAGAVLSIGSGGVEATGSGNAPLPLVACEAGSADDVIKATVIFSTEAAS